jgi:hypothetical protein
LSRVVKAVRNLRLRAVSGYNATENNAKMSGVVLGPVLAVWFIVKMFTPPEMYDTYMMYALGFWLLWCGVLYAYCKTDAQNYVVFPASKWRFSDGGSRTFDVKIAPDSWEELGTLPDGSVMYKVFFSDKYVYEDLDLPYPRVWSKAYWLLPAHWDRAFKFRAIGEIFHKGIIVSLKDCEDISVYVLDWESSAGEDMPLCLINDCGLQYERTMESYRVPELMHTERNPFFGVVSDLRKQVLGLVQHEIYLEDRLKISEEQNSEDFRKSGDEVLKSVVKRHRDIMQTQKSFWSRITNLKTLAIVILVLFAVFMIGRFFFGLW